MTLKVVTINILSDLSRWDIRRELLVTQLADLSPDIITIQEVTLPENPARWLAEELSLRSMRSHRYNVFLCPKSGSWGRQEAIAILSRLPVKAHETTSLGEQGRVAQKIQLDFNGETVYITNVHLFWQPGHSESRIQQVYKLIRWMDGPSRQSPVAICGDFNDTPGSETIRMMKKEYKSVYNLIHHDEPKFTYPTPLPVSLRSKMKTIFKFAPYIRLRLIKLDRRDTLDYIFANHKFNVQEAKLVLNKAHPAKLNIYPSDHYGLFAKITNNR